MSTDKLSPGQRAYEQKRAAKAGLSLEAWLRDKEKRARTEESAEPVKQATPKKPGFFSRLIERAQKPL